MGSIIENRIETNLLTAPLLPIKMQCHRVRWKGQFDLVWVEATPPFVTCHAHYCWQFVSKLSFDSMCSALWSEARCIISARYDFITIVIPKECIFSTCGNSWVRLFLSTSHCISRVAEGQKWCGNVSTSAEERSKPKNCLMWKRHSLMRT